jgi:hypothetical protein
MSVASRLSSCQLSFAIAKPAKSTYPIIIGLLIFCLFFASHGLMQAQTAATVPAQTTQRIIVKLKPSLAGETETQLNGASAQSDKAMHIHAGQSGNARIEDFLRRHSAQQISPLYPQIIRLKKQHGWSDAQMAAHIRQRFARRAQRVAHPMAAPEISDLCS